MKQIDIEAILAENARLVKALALAYTDIDVYEQELIEVYEMLREAQCQ